MSSRNFIQFKIENFIEQMNLSQVLVTIFVLNLISVDAVLSKSLKCFETYEIQVLFFFKVYIIKEKLTSFIVLSIRLKKK